MSLNLHKLDEELKNDFDEEVINRRKNQKKYASIFITAFLVIIIGVPTIIAYFIYQSYSYHSRLNNGSKTVATIDNKYIEKRSTTRQTARYDVSYSFELNEKTYSGTTAMPHKPTSKYAVVIYDPEDPENNKLESGEDSFEELFIGCIAVLIFAVVFNLFVFARKKFT